MHGLLNDLGIAILVAAVGASGSKSLRTMLLLILLVSHMSPYKRRHLS